MANRFSVSKAERTKLRRFPFLPRLGVTLEIAGRQFTYKQVPWLETMVNLKDRGFSLANLKKVMAEELGEIDFPAKVGAGLASVRSFKDKAEQAKGAVLKKGAVKGASRKKS